MVGYARTTKDPTGSGCGPSETGSTFQQVRTIKYINSHEQLRGDKLTWNTNTRRETTLREIKPFWRIDRRTLGT